MVTGGSLIRFILLKRLVLHFHDSYHRFSLPPPHDALVALGLFMLSRGEAEKALECFNRVSQADPRYPGIWRFKAKAFDALGDAESAKQCRLRGADPRS